MKTDDKCQECKKDWTKCDKCPVMIEWVKEHRKEKAYQLAERGQGNNNM